MKKAIILLLVIIGSVALLNCGDDDKNSQSDSEQSKQSQTKQIEKKLPEPDTENVRYQDPIANQQDNQQPEQTNENQPAPEQTEMIKQKQKAKQEMEEQVQQAIDRDNQRKSEQEKTPPPPKQKKQPAATKQPPTQTQSQTQTQSSQRVSESRQPAPTQTLSRDQRFTHGELGDANDPLKMYHTWTAKRDQPRRFGPPPPSEKPDKPGLEVPMNDALGEVTGEPRLEDNPLQQPYGYGEYVLTLEQYRSFDHLRDNPSAKPELPDEEVIHEEYNNIEWYRGDQR